MKLKLWFWRLPWIKRPPLKLEVRETERGREARHEAMRVANAMRRGREQIDDIYSQTQESEEAKK